MIIMPLSEYKGSVEVNVENNAGTYTVTTNSYNFNNLIKQTIYNYTPGGSPTPTPVTPTAYLTFTESNGATFTLVGRYDTGTDLPDGSQEILNKHWDGKLYYSIDTVNWTEWDGTQISSSSSGNLYLAGENNTAIDTTLVLEDNKDISVVGNVESLLDHTTVENGQHPAMGVNCFKALFYDDTSLKSSPTLPATLLSAYCYSYMFHGTSLSDIPVLPATTLAEECYGDMFFGCDNITTLQGFSLPATTLAPKCYIGMFAECKSLTTIGSFNLPALTLTSADNCYANMFSGCTSLTTAPSLPATTLEHGCYFSMFRECSSLTTPPALPATEVYFGSYEWMFYKSGITTAPSLPATILAKDCYAYMFADCSSLVSPPALPATTLYTYCYNSMFSRSGITTAPDLPATTLAHACYQNMFADCNSLTGTIHCAASTASDPENIDNYPYAVPSGVTVVYDL